MSIKPNDQEKKVVIAISARALFDLEKENELFEREGMAAYYNYQIKNEKKLLNPGGAFPLVRAFLDFNNEYKKKHKEGVIEVVIVSKNSPEAAMRIFRSMDHYKLGVKRAAFLGGGSLTEYLGAFNTSLYLSKDPESVREALKNGFASASIMGSLTHFTSDKQSKEQLKEVRIALDADSVVFSDESDKVYEQQGEGAFRAHEKKKASTSLPAGPFAKFVRALAEIKAIYPMEKCPIKLAIVTAREPQVSERVLRTLKDWNVSIDKAFFLGGASKAKVLDIFKPHIFFDDKRENLEESAIKNICGEVLSSQPSK